MALVGRRGEALALEHMSKVATAVGAYNLRPRHAKRLVLMSGDGAGEAVKVGGPAAARLELVVGLVERRVAAGAGVYALFRVVLVKLATSRGLCSLFPKDAELLCESVSKCSIPIMRPSVCAYLCSEQPSTHHCFAGRGKTCRVLWKRSQTEH